MAEEFSDREPIWGWREDKVEIMEKQIDLAADNGLLFFAFDWYYFPDSTSDQSLNDGLKLYSIAKNKNRLKYCLFIANHAEHKIKGTENWKKAANIWVKYFKDKNYVTVNGKPLIIIFIMTDYEKEGFDYIQTVAKKNGLPGVTIATSNHSDYEDHYSVLARYNYVKDEEKGGGEKRSYKELTDENENLWHGHPNMPIIPTIMAGWDKRPWEKPEKKSTNSVYYSDRTPEDFQHHVKNTINWVLKYPEQVTKEKLILIYAWNEMGEGGYIIPTKGDPTGMYLKAVKKALTE
jgi:hypothetical protein